MTRARFLAVWLFGAPRVYFSLVAGAGAAGRNDTSSAPSSGELFVVCQGVVASFLQTLFIIYNIKIT
jgi:hypothetical protein